MGLPTFFKLPQYNRFQYTPLYYDEKKETREKRNAELGLTAEPPKPGSTIKGNMRRKYNRSQSSNKTSNIRILLIAGMLLIVAYWILFM